MVHFLAPPGHNLWLIFRKNKFPFTQISPKMQWLLFLFFWTILFNFLTKKSEKVSLKKKIGDNFLLLRQSLFTTVMCAAKYVSARIVALLCTPYGLRS